MDEVKKHEEVQKSEKPFYKKWWFIVGVILLVIIIGNKISANKDDGKWSELELGKYIPEAKKGRLDFGSNLSNYLSLTLENVSKDYYLEYKEECIKAGYTVESDSDGNSYEAYNADGYKLRLSYSNDEIWIVLNAPKEMKELDWPTEGLATKIPKPNSSMGNVSSDSSNSYRVLVDNMTMNDFENYVRECKNKGFTVDYNKRDTSYSAKNSEGYRLDVSYNGNNKVDILIQTPEEEEEEEKPTPTSTPTPTPTSTPTPTPTPTPTKETEEKKSSSGIRAEFKKAMDSYEKLMNEYINFMKKYEKNPSNTELLKDYAKYMKQYSEATADFEKWNSKDLNKEETKYYLDVQNRINQKLLDLS